MSRARLLIALTLFLCGLRAAGAVDATTPPSPTPEEISLQGFATATPRCAEWSDGCAVCTRDNGAARCSTPGIACQAGPIVCRREVDK
jgi:hypothetical protein